MPTLIVGICFGLILIWALNRSRKDIAKNQCAGCGKKDCPSRKK